jgi:osmotically-inducible protein OsmY
MMSSIRTRDYLIRIAAITSTITLMGMTALGCSSRAPVVQRDDAAITTDVEARLAGDPQTSALKVAVTTKAGLVQLSGTVPTEPDRNSVERIARATPGVAEVDNDLTFGGK